MSLSFPELGLAVPNYPPEHHEGDPRRAVWSREAGAARYGHVRYVCNRHQLWLLLAEPYWTLLL